MSRTILIATTIALSSAFMPIVSNAADPVTPATSTDMTKDAWLASMTPLLPDLICKGFIEDADLSKRFTELKITYEQCATMIPPISTKCQDQIYADIPSMINEEIAGIWGRKLGECIGKNFAEQYLVPKK